MREERRRHFVMLGIGGISVFGDGPRRHIPGERRIVLGIAAGQPCRGARAHPLDGAADHEIGQRHPLGGADHPRYEAHVTAPFCGGSGKNRLVRD